MNFDYDHDYDTGYSDNDCYSSFYDDDVDHEDEDHGDFGDFASHFIGGGDHDHHHVIVDDDDGDNDAGELVVELEEDDDHTDGIGGLGFEIEYESDSEQNNDYYDDDDDDDDDDEEEGSEIRFDLLHSNPTPYISSAFLHTTPMNRFSVLDDDDDRRDDNGVTREVRIQDSEFRNLAPMRGEEGNGGSIPIERVEELGKKVEKCGETASSSEKDRDGDVGSCSICLEPLSVDGNGDHSICCLPCGHIYGMSCIKSWLQQPNAGKCPQCNEVCGLDDIRKIYGLMIGTADKELQEKIQLLEARCASLELKDADWHRKESEWRQKEARLLLQLKQGNV